MNGDGIKEIITIDNGAYIIDTTVNGLNKTLDEDYTSLAVTSSQAFLGSSDGSIYRLYGDTSVELVGDVCDADIDGLEATSETELALTCGGRLAIYDLASDAIEWQMDGGSLDSMLGDHDSIEHTIVEGRSSLLVGGSTVYHFVK